jgi:uncharacterized repeat protein (TIGR01451 family)
MFETELATAGRRTTIRPGRRLSSLGAIAIAVAVAVLAPAAQAATFTVSTTADSGPGSLRQAITDVNATVQGTPNTIAFAIPGSGPHVIAPVSALPFIFRDFTTIDGCTQPGADCGAFPLKLQVQLHGQGLGVSGGNGVTIRGLSITGTTGSTNGAITNNRAARDGKFVLSRDLMVEKNFLGIAPDGSAAGNTRALQLQPGNRGLSEDGLQIVDNVIGSNANTAIDLRVTSFQTPDPIDGLRIARNIIGLDPTATQPRPNGGDGIVVGWSAGAEIVGNVVARSLGTVAGSTGAGIVHQGRTQAVPGSDPAVDPGLLIQGNVVEGNVGRGIVLDVSAPVPAPSGDANTGPAQVFSNIVRDNGAAGISVLKAVGTVRPNFQIGAIGQANVITDNDGPGVAVGADGADTSVAVTVRGNSIYANTGQAIDLASDGPTANGPAGLPRTGPNQLVNFPLITEIEHGSVIVNGTYTGAANTAYTLDFYKSETASGPQSWIGTTSITTDADGEATYSAEFDPGVPEGWLITATATNADGSTSELGDASVVPPAPPAPTTPEPSPSPGAPPSSPSGGAPKPAPTSPNPRKLKLRLTDSVDRPTLRPGETATYTFLLHNPSRRAVHDVRVCTTVPAGLVRVAATPRPQLANGRYCWTAKTLAAGERKTYQITVRALPGASGRKLSRATARSADARTTGARSAIRVLAGAVDPGGVTG